MGYSLDQYDEFQWLVIDSEDPEEPVGFFDSREEAEEMISWLKTIERSASSSSSSST